MSGAGGYDQAKYAEVFSTMCINGVDARRANKLAVSAQTPTAMAVDVGTGEIWINGYWGQNPSLLSLSIDAADATNPRIDSVVIELVTTGSPGNMTPKIVKGTAAASPVAPTLTQTTTTWQYEIARVAVAAGATSIAAADITDMRGTLAGMNLTYTIDGGGNVLATGSHGYMEVPFDATIIGWVILADQSGSCVVDVKKATYSGFPTTASIAASAKPTLSTAQKNKDTTLTGWTTSLASGDLLEFVVDSVTTCTRVTVILRAVAR